MYMGRLNQRYIQDAVLRAKMIKKDHVVFGGRKLWKKLLSGLVTKGQWHEARDSELYSRGDRTKKGNPNIRVLRTPDGYKLRVGLSKPREFLTFKLYIPKKFQETFDLHNECYDVRIKFKTEKFYVYIGLDIPDMIPIYGFSNGVIGIDTNPDGLALVEINRDGNLVRHQYLKTLRLLFAQHHKRKNDIEDLAIQAVNQAILAGKGLVIEDLKFNDKKPSRSKKFNRMRHNFIYAQLLQAIERRALKDGIKIKKINPAFTSKAGQLKYQEMYSLNRHTAAALIIARRGMGICEKIRVKLTPEENKKLNLAGIGSQGRGFEIALTEKAYSYFKCLYQIIEVKVPGVTPPCFIPT